MSYFRVIPEIREEYHLDICEWLLFCLILNYPTVTMSAEGMGKRIGFKRVRVQRALTKLRQLGLVGVIDKGECKLEKFIIDKERFEKYLCS